MANTDGQRVALRNMDPSLWRQLKLAAAHKGVALTVYIQDALRSWLRASREKGATK